LPRYDDVIARVAAWSARDDNIAAVALLGSQVRSDLPADRWSDLDLMVLAHDAQAMMGTDDWLVPLGPLACTFSEVTALPFTDWNWCVKRALLADGRDVDFSIVPFDRLEQVLAINHEILDKGCRLLYDAQPPLLQTKLAALLCVPAPEFDPILSAEALENTIGALLHQAVWCAKKARRGELWVAAHTVNTQLADPLLRLIEMYNAVVTRTATHLAYEGRFLEMRTAPAILQQLRGCLAPYDGEAALRASGQVIDLTETLAAGIYAAQGRALDAGRFALVRRIYAGICRD
jgi:aminoglycoside 6-adenylyltransferase